MNFREWSRTKKLVGRFVMLVIVALVFAKVAPTLALEGGASSTEAAPIASISPEVSMSPSSPAADTATADASPFPAPILSPIPSSPVVTQILPVPNAQVSGIPSPTPSPTPSVLSLIAQKYQLGIPTSLPVDPRAHTIFLPSIKISGPQYSLVCISTLHSNVDVYNRNVADSIFLGKRLASGDLTPSVYLTGSTDQVSAIINGAGGFSIFDSTQGIANEHIFLQIVAVSAPTLNPAFCGGGAPMNTRVIQIYPLGLSIETRKGDVTLKG